MKTKSYSNFVVDSDITLCTPIYATLFCQAGQYLVVRIVACLIIECERERDIGFLVRSKNDVIQLPASDLCIIDRVKYLSDCQKPIERQRAETYLSLD